MTLLICAPVQIASQFKPPRTFTCSDVDTQPKGIFAQSPRTAQKMNNPTASPGRSVFRGAMGLFTSTATVLSPRVSRALILRISLLLLGRALLELVPVPLGALVGETVAPLVLNVLQTSIGVAALTAYMDSGGFFGAIASRLFAEKESAFVALYATLLFVAGPFLAIVEAAVVVYEAMSAAREWEAHMNQTSVPREASTHRALILAAATALYGATLVAAAVALKITASQTVPATIAATSCAYFTVAFVADQSNVLEGAVLSLYSAIVILVALVEELDVVASMPLDFLAKSIPQPKPEWRALALIITAASALFTLHRAPTVARIVLFGHHSVADAPSRPSVTTPTGEIIPPLALQSAGIGTAPPASQHKRSKRTGVAMVIAIIVVTFRVLVWSARLRPGEYYPVYARACQVLATFAIYVSFIRIEESEAAQEQ